METERRAQGVDRLASRKTNYRNNDERERVNGKRTEGSAETDILDGEILIDSFYSASRWPTIEIISDVHLPRYCGKLLPQKGSQHTALEHIRVGR